MYNSLDSSQWNSTDGSQDNAKRSTRGTSRVGTVRIESVPEPITTNYVRTDPSTRPVNIAAFVGIGIVLILATIFYFGIGNLRGDLLNQPMQTITLGADGFAPTTITLAVGSQFSIKNTSGQPQVLKTTAQTDGPIPIPQILFDATPVTLTVASSIAPGTYEYYPETMSQDKKITITVVPATSNVQTSDQSSSVQSSTSSMETGSIPIPFDINAAGTNSSTTIVGTSSSTPSPYTYTDTAQSSSIMSSSSSSIPTITTTITSSNDVVIDLSVSSSVASQESLAQKKVSLPTNSFTVGNSINNTKKTVIISTKTPVHNAAPSIVHPASNISSGMSEWVSILLTFIVFGFVARRMLRSSLQ